MDQIRIKEIEGELWSAADALRAGSPFRIPFDVAVGKKYVPLVSEWLKSKYCNCKGINV